MRVQVLPCEMVTVGDVNYVAGDTLDLIPDLAKGFEAAGKVRIVEPQKEEVKSHDTDG